jgi:hypothetical protein
MFCCQYCYKVRRPNFSHRIEMNSNVLTVMQSYVISEMNKSKNNYSLLGYNAVQSGTSRKFRSNLSHPCSKLKSKTVLALYFRLMSYFAYFSTPNIATLCTSETSFACTALYVVLSQRVVILLTTAVRTSIPIILSRVRVGLCVTYKTDFGLDDYTF